MDVIKVKYPEWLPAWMLKETPIGEAYPSLESRMELAIRLSRTNIEQGTGGPFGAAVFERDSGKLVSIGVNLVVETNRSDRHAEMVAINLANSVTGCWDLAHPDLPPMQLVSSAQPCLMCFGRIENWSGVKSFICAATGNDVEAIGFKEGVLPVDWQERLIQKEMPCEVQTEFMRSAAVEVLRQYQQQGGAIYNGGKSIF